MAATDQSGIADIPSQHGGTKPCSGRTCRRVLGIDDPHALCFKCRYTVPVDITVNYVTNWANSPQNCGLLLWLKQKVKIDRDWQMSLPQRPCVNHDIAPVVPHPLSSMLIGLCFTKVLKILRSVIQKLTQTIWSKG